MPIEDTIEFDGDDESYLHWLAQNPYGFVINTERAKNPNIMVLHAAACSTISEYTKMAKPGGFTERDYIKICAKEVDTLKSWVRRHGRPNGSFSSECSICNPLEEPDYYYD